MASPPYGDQAAAPVLYDLDPADLVTYRPARDEPPDFDLFWKQTLQFHGGQPSLRLARVDAGLFTVDTFDAAFAGYGGQPVKAWLVLPKAAARPLPCMVQFVGYGDGRGLAIDHLLWASAGYAHLVMDTRGQGGETPDRPVPPGADIDGPPVVRGLRHPSEYYYRRLFVDAVRAVEAVRACPEIDPGRVVVAGASQGGGVALAAAALVSETISAVLCDLPFLSHWRRAARVSDRGPYTEVARYCARHRLPVDQAFATLRYFDVVAFAARCHMPASFSVALADRVCPPSTVYAAYNHYAGDKRIVVWEFNDHEGGGSHQARHHLTFLRELWSTSG
jgi:cephalosporin-C deacetylase